MQMKKPEQNILWVWRIRLILLLILPASLNSWFNPIMSEIWFWITCFWGLILVFFYCFYLPIKYKKTSYYISCGEFFVTTGVFYTVTKSIPLENVQFVTNSSTPLTRLFKLCTIKAVGAGGSIALSGLNLADGEELFILLKEGHNE